MIFLPDLSLYPVVAVDTETTGLKWFKDEVFGVSFAWDDGTQLRSIYVDIRDPTNRRWVADQLPRLRKIVGFHAKFDQHFLREAGFHWSVPVFEDGMIIEALINEHRHSYSLDSICRDRIGRGKEEPWERLAKIYGGPATKEAQIKNLQHAPSNIVSEYARADAELHYLLWQGQQKEIERQDLRSIVDFEHRLLEVIIDMERNGVRVDLDAAAKASDYLYQETIKERQELNDLAGWDVNVNSNPQVHRIVQPRKDERGNWQAKDGTPLEETEGGNASVKTAALYNMKFREAQLIASIRGMIKAREVFIDKYILEGHDDGYIHASINQTKTEGEGDIIAGTTTGRISITDPALQQIHKRDKKMAAIVRSCFLPDPGHVWGSFDWAQQDFRMFTHYVNEPKLLEAYEADPKTDYHSLVAELLSVPRNRDSKTGGANAKQLNLAMVFSMGKGRLCREMGLPYYVDDNGYLKPGPEGLALFEKYHATIPGVEKLQENVEKVAKNRGYILTPLRRRLHFPNGHGAYKAAGLLYQAACADALKLKMVEMYERLRGTESRLMLTVHDEQDVSMAGDVSCEQIVELLQRFDGERTPMKFRVPIVCEGGTGVNWWEASK
jgi:DNA polymerase-1